MYTTVRVPLLLDAAGRRRVWKLRARQRQAYNLGVELGLGSERVPSVWSGYKTLTARRRSGDMPAHSLRLQRAGLRRGLTAVDQFRRARFGLEGSVAYWKEATMSSNTLLFLVNRDSDLTGISSKIKDKIEEFVQDYTNPDDMMLSMGVTLWPHEEG